MSFSRDSTSDLRRRNLGFRIKAGLGGGVKVKGGARFSLVLAISILCGAMLPSLGARLVAQNQCWRCNIVDEGLHNQNLVNRTVYFYSRRDNRFYETQVTDVYREGPFRVINWYDPRTGKTGKNDATQYYSYRSMQQFASGPASQPGLSQSERQDKAAWFASCRLAESDNFFEALVGRQGCCESSAARRYGPAKICR